MKKLIIAAALLAAAAAPAMAQTAVSISVGQPNFFGRIDLGGGMAPPPVVYAQPVIVERQERYVAQPVYLRVPEGHRKHWNKHCREYNACGQQVYFVQDGWYSNTYAPRYREQHYREYREVSPRGPVGAMVMRSSREATRDDRRDYERRDERRDHDDRDDDHGHGHGNGHGKGHDKHGD